MSDDEFTRLWRKAGQRDLAAARQLVRFLERQEPVVGPLDPEIDPDLPLKDLTREMLGNPDPRQVGGWMGRVRSLLVQREWRDQKASGVLRPVVTLAVMPVPGTDRPSAGTRWATIRDLTTRITQFDLDRHRGWGPVSQGILVSVVERAGLKLADGIRRP